MGKSENVRERNINLCSYCGKEIFPPAEPIYIRTQRRTELHICPACYRDTLRKK